MGRGHYDLGLIGPKLTFSMAAEDKTSDAPIRVKVEISTRERTAYDAGRFVPFSVKNPWFTGAADIATFSNEEMLATKLRALLQRDKGRDLVDLAHAVAVFDELDSDRVIEYFGKYLAAGGQAISRAEAEAFDGEAGRAAFRTVYATFIKRLPGNVWAQSAETAGRLGMPDLTTN
jgi:predicted nucleotidyltransferase component of viral defense system